MAVNYTIPPWLNQQGADPASAFVSAFRAGASVALEKAQLQRQSENAAMAAAIRQQENEQQARRADQKIAIEAAQVDAQLGLRQQALDIAQQRAVQTAKTAALSFQVQETYRRRVAAGEDPQKVLLELGPSMGITSGLPSMVKAPRELMKPGDPEEVPGLPSHLRAQTGPESWQYIPKPVDPDSKPKPRDATLVELEKALAKAEADLIVNKRSKAAEYIPKLKARIAEIKGSAAGSSAKPVPFKEGDMIRSKKDGKLYKVVNGKPELVE